MKVLVDQLAQVGLFQDFHDLLGGVARIIGVLARGGTQTEFRGQGLSY
jgi:hypothetical protein